MPSSSWLSRLFGRSGGWLGRHPKEWRYSDHHPAVVRRGTPPTLNDLHLRKRNPSHMKALQVPPE